MNKKLILLTPFIGCSYSIGMFVEMLIINKLQKKNISVYSNKKSIEICGKDD